MNQKILKVFRVSVSWYIKNINLIRALQLQLNAIYLKVTELGIIMATSYNHCVNNRPMRLTTYEHDIHIKSLVHALNGRFLAGCEARSEQRPACSDVDDE